MKILSLNVNCFAGEKNMMYTEYFTRLDECPKANEIIAFVKGFLFGNPDGLVLLYEIPCCEFQHERLLYKEFLQQFPDENYACEISGKKPKICTIAIWNRKDCAEKVWTRQDDFGKGKADYCNRFVELAIERGGSTLRVLGIHAPYGELDFFEALKEYALDKGKTGEKLIIVGDLNVHEKEPSIYLAQIHEIVNSGYSTEIKDGEITYFPNGHTIDHVLVSPELKDKDNVDAYVIPQKVLELSDHAVIIVDVKI